MQRSSLNTILQGRSPVPQQQAQTGINLIQQQQSPYQNNSSSARFTTLLRSPNTSNVQSTSQIRHDVNNSIYNHYISFKLILF